MANLVTWNNLNLDLSLSLGNTYLSWLQPLGREPSEEPFCEQEEHEDFLGVGCHMVTPWSISSKATAHSMIALIITVATIKLQ